MKSIIEKILVALLIAAVVMTVLGIVLAIQAMIVIAMVCLILASSTYAVLQIKEYLQPLEDETVKKQLLIMMIVSVAVALVVLCLGILTIAGKLF